MCKFAVKQLSILCAFVGLIAGLGLFSPGSNYGQVSVATGRNDLSRTGQNVNETILTPSTVNASKFGKLFAQTVDGFVVAQPLYLPGVLITGRVTPQNVVYVATQHDSVYAFDADTDQGPNAAPLWHVSFINPSAGITTVPIDDQGCGVVTKFTEVGIMGTPVIDPASGTLYVSAKTKENDSYVYRLHALDITSGQEKFGGPVEITASVTIKQVTVTFDPHYQAQRPGLLLLNGAVYVALGSNGCDSKAYGWLIGYNASNLQQQVGVFNTSPNIPPGAAGSTIWQGGAGPAADSSGNIYVTTANGYFNADRGGSNFGDSVLKLSLGGKGLTWTDYFTPYNQRTLRLNDWDLGSGGAVLLPDQSGPHTHLLVTAGKQGTIYLIDRDNMRHFNSSGDQIVQELPGALKEIDGNAAFWNNTVYFAANIGTIKAYTLTGGLLSTTPAFQTKYSWTILGTVSISANGNTNGILWVVRGSPRTPGGVALGAFNASNLVGLYNTSTNSTRDAPGATPHFVAPTIANGKVYLGTQTQLVVYGLLSSKSSAGN